MGSCMQTDSLTSTLPLNKQGNNAGNMTSSNSKKYFLSKKKMAHDQQKHQFILSRLPEKPTSILDLESPTELESKKMQCDKLEGDQPLSAPFSMDEILFTKLQEPIKPQTNNRKIRFLSQESDIQSSREGQRAPRPKTQQQICLRTVLKRNMKRRPKSKQNRGSPSGFSKSVHFKTLKNWLNQALVYLLSYQTRVARVRVTIKSFLLLRVLLQMNNQTEEGGIQKQITRQRISRFPQKLRKMLNVFIILGKSGLYENCLCWNSDGTKIIIKNKEELGRIVLPQYFRTHKISTFMRQLNLFCFKHTSDEFNNLIYYHEEFRQNMDEIQLPRQEKQKSLKSEHKQLQLEVQHLVQQQQKLQQQISLMMKFHKSITKVQAALIKAFARSALMGKQLGVYFFKYQFILRKGLKIDQTFGNEIGQAVLELLGAIQQNYNLQEYQEESLSFYSDQLINRLTQ